MTFLHMAWGLALLVLGLALIPTRTGGLSSHPHPALDYADAVARVERQQRADSGVVAAGGLSILLVHGARTPRAVVLFHGITNSPRQFLEFGRLLYAAGDNVYVPRLPHHAERGGNVGALARVTAEELRDCADSAADAAVGLGDTVVVLGLSAGGNMAAWLAQNRADVHRAVIVAPALEISGVPGMLEKPLMNFTLRIPDISRRSQTDTARPDRDEGITTRGFAQMLRLGVAVQRAAAHRSPAVRDVAFLLNGNDGTVKPGPALELARKWSSRGANVATWVLPDTLGLPHDVVDVTQPKGMPAVVYPVLEALVHGTAPPPPVTRRQ